MFLEAGSDGSEVLQLVEEALGEVAIAVEERAEGRDPNAPGHGLDVGPGAAFGEAPPKRVRVIGAVGEEDLSRTDAAQHLLGAPAVVRLALGELQHDRQAVRIDQSVDLGR